MFALQTQKTLTARLVDTIMEKQEEKSKAFSSINARSFLLVVILLGGILVLSGLLSYLVPQGAFHRDSEGMIIDGT